MSIFALILVLAAAVMHAAWNLFVHAQRQDHYLLIRLTLVYGLVGLVPFLVAELLNPTLTRLAWGMLGITAIGQTMYVVGLTRGYRTGDFTVVYPLVRALPILFLALMDIMRGRMPSMTGWSGIVLVTLGCVLLGVQSMRGAHHIRSFALWFWIVLTAAGTVCYSAADKIGLESMPSGINAALRYSVLEFLLGAIGAALCLGTSPMKILRSHPSVRWMKIICGAVLLGGGYVLILWVYQLVDQVSYVVAGRQISIVIGVVLAASLLHEHVGIRRILIASVIAAGVALIALA